MQVPELRKLAIQRNRSVVKAIRKRLPRGAPAGAELLHHSVIAGATTQWAVEPRGELADHVLAQLAAALRLMFPDHDGFRGSLASRKPRGPARARGKSRQPTACAPR